MDIEKYIYSECQNPTKVKIYNGIKHCWEYKNVPCGKCYHCKITRINEWVTRMVIQSNYSKYVYFGTLTYASLRYSKHTYESKELGTINYSQSHGTIYTYECLPYRSAFNKQNRLCDNPMILRKDHVQKFLKRLRKNTGIKIQYAYCGEYGSTYSRPHYHYIIWSNEPIEQSDIYKAWRAPSISNPNRTNIIGRVDHVDIKNNPRQVAKNGDVTSVYKYVCKYIQKSDFNFNELKNYKQHEINYREWFENQITKGISHDDYVKKFNVTNFYIYQEMCRPFFHCSKKPAIGFNYLEDNLGEFQKGNFKLFGLQGHYIFPLYFIRKTKESLCPIKAQSETNEGTTSYSRIPRMATMLENIRLAQQIAEDTEYAVSPYEYRDKYGYYESARPVEDLEIYRDQRNNDRVRTITYRFGRDYLGFTNHATKVKYIFCGDNYEMYSTTTHEFLGTDTIENVHNLILYYYDILKNNILWLLSAKSEVSANKKAALIEECGGITKFESIKEQCIQQFNNKIADRQRKYKQTKTLE